jgi:DNA repair exonuclease SbcCD ATPase subunit
MNKQEYNLNYYNKNKSKILECGRKRECCPICNVELSHQNLKRHQKSKRCQIHIVESEKTELECLKERIAQLEEKMKMT